MNAREAAYIALLYSFQGERFIADTLETWRKDEAPTTEDYHLAQEIANGTARMALACDYLAKSLTHKHKLKLKLKERLLVRMAFYQHFYMDRIPLYAIADETIKIAKQHCHQRFLGFLNALIRKLEHNQPQLPEGSTPSELSIRYSFPLFFVEKLIQDYGTEVTVNLLKVSNLPPKTMVRIRPNAKDLPKLGLEIVDEEFGKIALLKDFSKLGEIAASEEFYIQNATPAWLIYKLAKKISLPEKVLDLCASPGGKAIAIHDCFPNSELYLNDVTEEKLKRLTQNLAKYHIFGHIKCSRGEEYHSSEKFDLIILDVPCSNSGVLSRRPEARWRLSQEAIAQLETVQMDLIEHAKTLLKPHGQIWYMSCSVLLQENEHLIQKACNLFDLKVLSQEKVLPNSQGWDGGFACVLQL